MPAPGAHEQAGVPAAARRAGVTAAAERAAALTRVLRPESPATPVAAADIEAVLRAHGEPEPVAVADSDVPAMRAVAARLRGVFAAPDLAAAALRLNAVLRDAARPPRLSNHDGSTAWHLHADAADDAPWADWFAASSAVALATLLAERQAKPGGLCAAAGCGAPFADLGRGAPRRYCSSRCATRERVTAYRRARSARQ